MRTINEKWLLVGLFFLLALPAIFTGSMSQPRALFRRLVQAPVPKSVSGIDLKANDILHLSLTATGYLESTYFMKFSAAPEDMDTIVRQGGFCLAADANAAPGGLMPPGAPFWWKDKSSLDGLELYTRPGKICGTDYLWIDNRKTTAFYMLWNI